MSISIDELFQPPTVDAQVESFLASLEILGVPARSWRKAGALRTMLKVVAMVYVAFATTMTLYIKASFLETSTGDWLTLLALHVYGVTRISATFATGAVTLVNTGGATHTIAIGALLLTSPTTGKAYFNTAAIVLNPGATLTGVTVQAVERGAASSAPAATITKLETALAGVTVTNPLAVVGSDAEKDPDLRQRCKDKLGILGGKGPRGAYGYAIKSATRPDGSAVDINRYAVSPSSSTGIVTIYCASSSGAPAATDIDYVRTSIEALARPDTVTANTNGAVNRTFTESVTVWARRTDGVTEASIGALVANALVLMQRDYPIGGIAKPPSVQGYLWASTYEGTIKAAHPSIFATEGLLPDASRALAVNEVAVLVTNLTIRLVEAKS